MKTTRQYLSGCTWCNGTGFVKQPNSAFMSISLTIICPVCNGGKTVIVTETVESEDKHDCDHERVDSEIEGYAYCKKCGKTMQ